MQLIATGFVLSALVALINAHGVMVSTGPGTNGVPGRGLGVDPNTPRDGTRRNPFQQDTAIIRPKDQTSGKAGPCGRTLGGGNIDIPSGVAAQMAEFGALPQVTPGGQFAMTIHQINGDGAGPYTCEMDATGTGNNFVAMQVITNVPGRNGNSGARTTDFPLTVQMPAGMKLTGGPNGNMGLIRMRPVDNGELILGCKNPARAGPFGGCAAVQMGAGSSATATNATATRKRNMNAVVMRGRAILSGADYEDSDDDE